MMSKTLTANYEYSRSNRESLTLPIQMQLSEKPNSIVNFLLHFWDYIFEHFFEKNEPHSLSIFEVIDDKRRAYLTA